MIAIAVTYRWGIIAMIYGQIATSCIAYFLNAYYTGKLIKYYSKEQIFDFLPYLAISAVMGVGVHFVQSIQFPNNISLLISQFTTGIVIYCTFCFCLRLSAFMEAYKMLFLRKALFSK